MLVKNYSIEEFTTTSVAGSGRQYGVSQISHFPTHHFGGCIHDELFSALAEAAFLDGCSEIRVPNYMGAFQKLREVGDSDRHVKARKESVTMTITAQRTKKPIDVKVGKWAARP